MNALLATTMKVITNFAFYYPLFMAYLWSVGAVFFFLRLEYRKPKQAQPLDPDKAPGVSIIIPMFNEGENAREVIAQLARLNYPNFEIIAVNDASKDSTTDILDELADEVPKLRVVHLASNQGKAVGLTSAAMVAKHEYLVCIDGDALLDADAIFHLVKHFEASPKVGAVTGNPRIRNRSTLLGRIQVGEFSSLVGFIKRAQRIYGRIFTVSGVIAAFRRRALHSVGYWSCDILTEDIDISWKLQTAGWDLRFEPSALCWILTPETLKGLWRQRLRWSMGGMQVLIKYSRILGSWKQRSMWIVYLEVVTSVLWAFDMVLVFLCWLVSLFTPIPFAAGLKQCLPQLMGTFMATTCLLQIALALTIDKRYDNKQLGVFVWMIWYPLIYWMLQLFTTLVAVPKVIFRRSGVRARWKSPDRGIRVEISQ